MRKIEKTVFERLYEINVNANVEKKNGLTYLSWAWAWAEVKKECPDANYRILGYTYDEKLGYMVTTEVTIENETITMWLPVMDGANKPLFDHPYTYKKGVWENGKKIQVDATVEAANMFDINKTYMRCLVKNLAMFGLGLYIYAGEDLPESDQPDDETKALAKPPIGAPPKKATPPTAGAAAPPKVATPPAATAPPPAATAPPKTATAPPAAKAEEKKAPVGAAPKATTPPAPTTLPLLKIDTAHWENVKAYVLSNKDKGEEFLLKQVSRKYTVVPSVQKDIIHLLKANA